MRAAGRPWTLGEVLSGGIGGWVHRFGPAGPCYGCVASHLKRTVADEPAGPAPDYSNPGGPVAEARVPASKASISAVASLHAVVTLDVLTNPDRRRGGEGEKAPDFTSLLMTLARVPGVFDEPFRTYRMPVPKLPGCLVCGTGIRPPEELDAALDQALDRLGPA
jgi:hypothetical protein